MARPSRADWVEVEGCTHPVGVSFVVVLLGLPIWLLIAAAICLVALVVVTLRNIGDVPNEDAAEGPSTPGHAKLRLRERYGSLWTFGIKGTF